MGVLLAVDVGEVVECGLPQHAILHPRVSLQILNLIHHLPCQLNPRRILRYQALHQCHQPIIFYQAWQRHTHNKIILTALHNEVIVAELGFKLLGVNGSGISDADKWLWFEVDTNAVAATIHRWWQLLLLLTILLQHRHKHPPGIILEIHQHLLILLPQELQIPVILHLIVFSWNPTLPLTNITALELRLSQLTTLKDGLELVAKS